MPHEDGHKVRTDTPRCATFEQWLACKGVLGCKSSTCKEMEIVCDFFLQVNDSSIGKLRIISAAKQDHMLTETPPTHLSPIVCKGSFVERGVWEEHALNFWIFNAIHLYTPSSTLLEGCLKGGLQRHGHKVGWCTAQALRKAASFHKCLSAALQCECLQL